MSTQPDEPWAKLVRAEDNSVRAALPLIEHSLDVGSTMAALLAGAAWAPALEQAAGRPLTVQEGGRVVVLAALHDIGKANAGFQRRWNETAEPVGHEGQVAALWFDPGLRETAGGRALRETLLAWGTPDHLAALMAHHGRPREEFGPPPATGGRNLTWEKHRRHWHAADGYDPTAEVARLIAELRARYPLAWEDGPKLPDTPRFVALFAGLVTLADWLGSDAKRFPVEGPYGAARESMRQAQAAAAVAARGLLTLATPETDFAAAFDVPAPRGIQAEATATDPGPVALIEAETGAGKTEAALWRWLDLRRRGEVDGLYFALPTRSAAVQLHGRVQAMLNRVWGRNAIEAVLAVPGYLQAGDASGQALPGFEVRWDDAADDRRWAAEHANRYLAARVAVGTIDQALLAALPVKHAPFRAAALARSLLVVDEVHASDAYMAALLQRLLANHVAVGGRALLLSATLGAAARADLLGHPVPSLAEAIGQPFPALSGYDALPRELSSDGTRRRRIRVEIAPVIDEAEAIATRAIGAARAGASVLVVRNSVGGAVAVAQAVEAIAPDLAFRVAGVPTLHHGRFAPCDRRLLDAAVEAAFGKARTAAGRILVGTQTLEQSLDIDADLLLTDLAPMDVLLQRIGRLHRHPREDRGAFAEARVVVLRPAERDLSALITSPRHGLGPRKDGRGVYPDMLQIEATLRQLEENAVLSLPAGNRRLVENALHPEALAAIARGREPLWTNHANTSASIDMADQNTGRSLSVDFDTPFRHLIFPPRVDVATRLGNETLLVDFDEPLPGPFREHVRRIAIPDWMARGIAPGAVPVRLGTSEDGVAFRLGDADYRYGRWGLTRL